MDELYKAHYKKHLTAALEVAHYPIVPGTRLSCDTLIFLIRTTKDYYTRIHRRINDMMELSEEDINGAATSSLVWYLNTIGYDINVSNSKQCTADSACPTVLDFITTIIAGERTKTRESAVVDEEETESPSVPTESKSNTGTSGKFARFMRNKKHVDGKQLGNEKLDI